MTTKHKGLFLSRQQPGTSMFRLLFSRSVKRRKLIFYSIGIVLAVFAVLTPTIFYRLPTTNLRVAGKTVSLDIVSTEATREKGLGGRKSLAANKGMLFVLDKPSKQCLWMKGMEFPLDMLWLSSAKQVIYTQQNVSPKTYPQTFCPPSNARYIIELNAGQVKTLGIRAGQTLQFK